MSEVRFYHLLTQTLDQALPALVNKALSTGKRIIIKLPDEGQVNYFNNHLWVYNPGSFIPHGAENDGHAALQPVYLTHRAENPNGADMLILCNHQAVPENIADFPLCCDFLDGGDDDSVLAARTRWKTYKEAGHTVTYWQQTETGGWEQKA
ncbi:MAG: DNA polymerase III subunit chi [Micavibrio sp.]